jgi:26S proteasome regulatory subunit N11
VVDPIQSVKGKVVIDAFRLIAPQTVVMGQEPRQTTSNLGHLNKPSIQALIHGLNRHYYSLAINYRKTGLEENMLMNLHKHVWTEALQMNDFHEDGKKNVDSMQRLVELAEGYEKRVKEESTLTKEQLKTRYVGKVDPKKRKQPHPPSLLFDANRSYRHRGRWSAINRGQHCRRFKTNDQQGIFSCEGAEWTRYRERGTDGRG